MPLPPDVRPSICLAHPVAAGKVTTLPPDVDKWWGARFQGSWHSLCGWERMNDGRTRSRALHTNFVSVVPQLIHRSRDCR
jgi:hypothetical protein